MKRIIIMGATSGLGQEAALNFINNGWIVGIAGRRSNLLEKIHSLAPDRVHTKNIDICLEDADRKLHELIEELGGMDVYLHCSGIGSQNHTLNSETELKTIQTNGEGFVRMVTTAFNYFKKQKEGGHIAVISSIAGVKGLGVAPAYSASKRMQNTYLEALAQLAHMQRLNISFTDIRPGFVDTELLKGKKYPMLMKSTSVGRSIFHAIIHKKRIVIIDYRYRILVFFWKLIPQYLWERLHVSNRK